MIPIFKGLRPFLPIDPQHAAIVNKRFALMIPTRSPSPRLAEGYNSASELTGRPLTANFQRTTLNRLGGTETAETPLVQAHYIVFCSLLSRQKCNGIMQSRVEENVSQPNAKNLFHIPATMKNGNYLQRSGIGAIYDQIGVNREELYCLVRQILAPMSGA